MICQWLKALYQAKYFLFQTDSPWPWKNDYIQHKVKHIGDYNMQANKLFTLKATILLSDEYYLQVETLFLIHRLNL